MTQTEWPNLFLEIKKWIIGPEGKSQRELLTVIMHPKWLRVLCNMKMDCVKWEPGSYPFCDWQLLPVSFSDSNPSINDAFFISCWCPTWFDPPRKRSRLFYMLVTFISVPFERTVMSSVSSPLSPQRHHSFVANFPFNILGNFNQLNKYLIGNAKLKWLLFVRTFLILFSSDQK